MKKLILTGCAAALFGIASIAQVQDTTSTNNNLRQGAEQAEEDVNQAGNELNQGAERTGEAIEQGAERTGDQIEQGAEKTGEQIEQGAEKTGEAIEQGAERTGNEIEKGADRTKDKIDPNSPSAQENSNQNNAETASANAAPPQTEIEVLEDKEGPNNQVVYKYQGGLYYVNREEQKLVKIEESQLQDAEHKAIVSDQQ